MPTLVPKLASTLAYGGDYNPEQWPETIWPEDARLMEEAGVNLVSVGIFSWSRIQSSPTTWDFGWLDRILDLLHAHGVRVCLATATASPPPWLARLHPDSLPVTADGVTLQIGSRQAFSPSSPDYRRYAEALVKKIVKRYAKHPAVAAWHVGNEFACHLNECHGQHSVRAFRVWLKKRYKTIAAVNDAWGCAFWSQLYADWEEINTPKRAPFISNPAQQLDFKRFTNDSFLELYRMESAILKAVTPGTPVTTNLMAFFKPLDYHAWAREMDFIAWDSYPDPAAADDGRHWAAVGHDLTRSLKPGHPFIMMESATSAVNWRGLNRPKGAGLMRLQSIQAVARGADGVMFFQWRASLSGAEKFHSGMVPHVPTPKSRVFAEVKQVGNELKQLAAVTGSLVKARVAIVMDWHAWWALELEARPARIDYMNTLHSVHRAFYKQNIAVDFVHPEADLSGYALVVAPVLYLLTPKGADNLTTFVANGGTLLATYATGIVDSNDRIVPGGYPGLLRDTLGVWVEEWAPLGERFTNTVRLIATKEKGAKATKTAPLVCREWTEFVHADKADVLATFNSDLVAGMPALTRNRSGRGEAFYLATGLDDAGWSTIAKQLLAEAKVNPLLDVPEGVEISLREAAGSPAPAAATAITAASNVAKTAKASKSAKAASASAAAVTTAAQPAKVTRHLFVLNHRNDTVRVSTDKLRGTDLLTGKRVGASLSLKPLDAAVIALD